MSETKNDKEKKPLTEAQKLKIIEKGEPILEMRRSGASFRQIAAAMKAKAIEEGRSTRGVSHEQCRRDYKAVMALKLDDLGDSAVEVRILCSARLDNIYLKADQIMNSKAADNDTKLKAANVLTRVTKEYAELHGAKAPQRHEHAGKDGGPIQTVQVTYDDWRKTADERLNEATESMANFDEHETDHIDSQD